MTKHPSLDNSNTSVKDELQAVFETLPDEKLLGTLKVYYAGRIGYGDKLMWRCYVAMTYLNAPSVAAFVRLLTFSSDLREACGITGQVPSEFAFSRFLKKLQQEKVIGMVNGLIRRLVDKCKSVFPNFGEITAIDSTDLTAYSQSRKPSDRDARWSKKKNKHGRDHWWFGFKAHIVSCASEEIPMHLEISPANVSDSQSFGPVLTRAGVKARYVLADAGYDSLENYRYVHEELHAVPIIKLNPRGKKIVGRVPHRSKEQLKIQALRDQGGMEHNSPKWEAPYAKRTSIERLIGRMKHYRRLGSITVRGIEKVTVHALMSVVVTQAHALAFPNEPRKCISPF